jgi:hypothetical protein
VAPESEWEIEFFEGDDGAEPMRRFLDDLSADKADTLLKVLELVLGSLGLDVCRTEWGKALGDGLFEFRVRHDADEIEAAFGPGRETAAGRSTESVLLRVFFTAPGRRLILLFSGYDKGRDPSSKRQQKEIARARKLKKEWEQQQARDRKRQRRQRG